MSETPSAPSAQVAAPRELTWRAIALGAAITVLFTAANVYLGLKIGITFATSIPAAVISMAVLRHLPGVSIQENNIVQTIASAAGTLSAIIFVLPGLVMIGWWRGFAFGPSVAIIALGGVLGVMLSVPLRRALLDDPALPFPEGVAAAEVLKLGDDSAGSEDNARGLRAIVGGAAVSAGYALLAKLGVVAEEVSRFVRLGAGGTSLSASLSLALIGVGHLVGLAVGLAMLAGLVIGWLVLLPHYTAMGPPPGVEWADFVATTFRHKVRFVGAGTMGVAAIWTLLRVIGPVARGLSGALAAQRLRRAGQGHTLPLAERDVPIGLVGLAIALALVPVGVLLAGFAGIGPLADGSGAPLAVHGALIVALALAYVLVAGAIIALVCGYMAGLIGSSSSPVSGTGILTALGIALLLLAVVGAGADGATTRAAVAFALFVTSVIFGISTIANDNLQDLKTGQLVGATPWRQQVALLLGVGFGAVVIPPLLDLLNHTFGFAGTPGAGPQALAAPQAALITAIIEGVLGGNLDWGLIGLGAGIGIAAILVDEALRAAGRGSLPPLALGMGIYLPMGITLLTPLGALIGHAYHRFTARSADPARAERLGALAATGLIAGESLFGVGFAGLAAATGKPAPMALLTDFAGAAPLGLALCALLVGWLYRRTARAAR